MALELLFLGSGTSAGVPMIGCECPVCRSTDPRDQRSRPSVIIRYPDPADPAMIRRFVIDTAPEMRLQMIRHHIARIDGVFYTHAHADHILGIDDLRRFNAIMNGPVSIYAEQTVLDRLGDMFRYIFEPHNNINQSFVATLAPIAIAPGEPLELFGARWTPIRLMHGKLPVVGFRVDHQGCSLAYITDLSSVPAESYPLLANLDALVIDALRYRPHPLHLTIDQALAIIGQVKPGRAYFTHIAHDTKHVDIEAKLPINIRVGYDGLVVNCDAACDSSGSSSTTTEIDRNHLGA